jgi:hypothetical protein
MSERITEMTEVEAASQIPEPIRARLARPTVRLSGSVGHPMVASFFDQLLPVLEVEGSILVELYTDGGDAEIGRRLAEEVRLLRYRRISGFSAKRSSRRRALRLWPPFRRNDGG